MPDESRNKILADEMKKERHSLSDTNFDELFTIDYVVLAIGSLLGRGADARNI